MLHGHIRIQDPKVAPTIEDFSNNQVRTKAIQNSTF